MMNSTQCSDNLCQAIEIIANKVIQGLNYDKTILCTITDNKNANRGEYTVSDGVSSYSVYGSNQTYKVDTQVYVLIPNGDYEAQKLIISEYSPADEIEKGYSPPKDTIIPVETIYNTSNEIGLKANVNGEGNIGSAIKIKDSLKMNLSPKYTRLLLDCEFRTAFKEEIQSGNYSIVIIINGLDKDGFKIKGKKYIFDCSNFFGNPYNFEGGGVQQSIVFDTSIFSKINTISIQFQESGNFYNKDGDYLPVAEENNIFLSKFSMIIGFDIDEYKNNDLLITTTDDLSYENEKVKNLQLNWIRNRNNNTLFSINGTSDISLNNYNYLRHLWRTKVDTEEEKICYIGKSSNYLSFYWYRYTLDDDDLPTDILLQENYWKVEKSYNNKFYSLLPDEQKPFEFSFKPKVIGRAREKIKVAVAISGCLRKKVLKTQNIEVDNKIIEAAIVSKVNEYNGKVQYLKPDYDYIYYSPLEEIKVEEIFEEEKSGLDENNNAIIEKNIPAYSIDENGNYKKESKFYQRVKVEWVQYYSKKDLSFDDKGNPVYGEESFVYLTDDEYKELLDKKYSVSNSSDKYNIYNLILKPMIILKSNEIIFENKDKGVYKKLNLIKDIKLEATDELQGNYLIYDFSNTIPETTANSVNRNIKATFSSINSKDVITGNVVFQWKFPKSNTMLNEPQPVKLDNTVYKVINSSDGKLHWKDNKDGFYISSEVEILNSQSGNADETVELSVEIPYTIKRYYSPKQHNNKIIFLVYKKVNGSDNKDLAENKEKNKREINLSFGSSGTNGTNYTFVLNLGCKYISKNEEDKDDIENLRKETDEFQSFLNSYEDDRWIKVEANLFENNEKIDISEDKIDWSWHIAPYFYEDRKLSDGSKLKLRYKNIKWEKNSQNQLYIRTCRTNNCISDSNGVDKKEHKKYNGNTVDSDGDFLENSKSFKGKYHCAILKANISYNNKVLEAYLPIGMRFDPKAISFDIADKIVYNSNGTNPQYYMSYLRTYDENNNIIPLEYNIYVDHSLVPEKAKYSYPYLDNTISNYIYNGKSFILYDLTPTLEEGFYGYCSDLFKKDKIRGEIYRFDKDTLKYISKNRAEIVSQSNSKIEFYLLKGNSKDHLKETLYTGKSPCNASKTNSVLKASPIFYTNLSSQRVSILASNSTDGTYYVQPILIIQNRFGNSMLNEWDEKLAVDDKNNYILSAQVGAGVKNTDNSFTGVLMGDVSRSDIGSGVSKIGLYGYQSGILSFGLDIDGNAFFGKSGTGRISFNGTEGIITSDNYKNNHNGLYLNLATGYFNLKSLGRGEIFMSGVGSSDSPFFKIVNRINKVDYKFESGGKIYTLNLYNIIIDGVSNIYGYSKEIFKDKKGLPIFKNSSSDKNIVKPSFVEINTGVRNIKIGQNYSTISLEIKDAKNVWKKYKGILCSLNDQAEQIIFYADQKNYYLQSADYNSSKNIGTKIDLGSGTFALKSTGTGNNSAILRLSTTSPYFQIQKRILNSDNTTYTDKILVHMATNSYYLQSANYDSTNGIGLNINLNTGRIISRNTGGIISINPSSSSSLFNVKNSDNQTLINIGSSYYLQSANYSNIESGLRINLQSGGFSITSPLSKTSLTSAGIILSNNSNAYFKITKNYELQTNNISLTDDDLTKKVNLYFNPWGTSIIIKDLSTNKFYKAIFVNRTEGKPWVPEDIPNFMDRYSTFSMNSYKIEGKEQSTYSGYIYAIYGNSALKNLSRYIRLKASLQSTNEIIMGQNNYSYDSNNQIIKKANEIAGSDGKSYTLQYRLAKFFPTLNSKPKRKVISGDYAGHLNSLAYDENNNIIFMACGGSSKSSTIIGFSFDNKDIIQYNLKDSGGKNIGGIWEIAYDINNKYLYALSDKIYKYKVDLNNSTWKAIGDGISLSKKDDNIFDKSKYANQGLATDGKYFYMPYIAKNTKDNQQYLWVFNFHGNVQKQIKFKTDFEYQEIEEIDFDKSGYMYVSATSRKYDGVKIYKIKFDNNSLPTTINLNIPASYFIPNLDNEKYDQGQGFAIGYDKNVKEYFFVNAFRKSTGKNETDGLVVLNYLNELESLAESKAKKTTLIDISNNNFYLQSENYNLGNGLGTRFDLKTGKLITVNADITGKITATSGQIGGFSISSTFLKGGSGSFGGANSIYLIPNGSTGSKSIGGSSSLSGWVFTVANNFGILKDGSIYAKGSITATSGKIGRWIIDSDGLTSAGSTFKVKICSYSNSSDTSRVIRCFKVVNGKETDYFALYRDGSIKIRKGTLNIGNGKFKVDSNGNLTAKSGTIGGCKIDSSGNLQVPAANISGELSANSVTINNASIKSLSVGKLTKGTCGAAATFTDINASGGQIGPWYIDSNGGLYAKGTGPNNEVLKVFMQKPGATIKDSLLKPDWVYSIQKQDPNNPTTYTAIYYVNSFGQCHAEEYYSYFLKRSLGGEGSLDYYIKELWKKVFP